MNQQLLELAMKNARAAMTEWPSGAVVWHRASGQRGIVDGHKICGDGMMVLSVSFGTSGTTYYPFELSHKKVGDNTDGDEWKDENENSDTQQK